MKKRINRSKRTISFILSLIMIFGSVNMTVFSLNASSEEIIPVGSPAEVVNNTYNDVLIEETAFSQSSSLRNETSRSNDQGGNSIEDGAVYSFINAASGRYMTVHNGETASGTNVYQYYDDDNEDYELTISQAFRLDYNEDTEGYRIRAVCSNNGYDKVLEVPDFYAAIDGTNPNVRIFSYDEEYHYDQEWEICPYNNTNLYYIALKGDTDFVMTSRGTGNGSASGNTPASAGNIYVSEFTGSSNQLWTLESGGLVVKNTYNIKDLDAEDTKIEVKENTSQISFCCPATEFGQSVVFVSSNYNTAIVANGTTLFALKAGEATITARILNSNLTVAAEYSVKVYVALEDGAYYLINENSWYRLQYEDTNALYENAILETREIEEINESERFAMFKIKYLGEGLYSIRSMLDNSKGWVKSGLSIFISTIGTSNTSLPDSAKWRILSNSNGYYIQHSSGTSYVLDAISNYDGEDVALCTYYSTDTLQNWRFTKVTGSYSGTTIYDYTGKVVIGDTYQFKAVFYSTYPDINGENGITWDLEHNTAGAGSIDSSTGVLTGVGHGSFTVVAQYSPNSSTTWLSWVSGVFSIPVPEGRFFIRNAKHTDGYLQIDDNATDLSDDANIELFDFNADNNQMWHINYLYNGYYKIYCHASAKVLTAPDNIWGIVTQTDFESLNTQQWNISNTNGLYKFSPASNSTAYLSAGTDVSGSDLRARLRNNQSDDKDEWYAARIEYLSNTPLEGQQESNWCWVTSARMFAKHFYPNVTYTQSQAVEFVKGTPVNDGGTREDAKDAINFYISNMSGSNIDMAIKEYLIYSESTLVNFLDDGYVIYIARGWYDDMTDPSSSDSGHATLIYGYVRSGSEIAFLVRDPLPVNKGETYFISYEKLCNGSNAAFWESPDNGVWRSAIVVNTEYDDDTIPYYFDQ